MIPCYKIQLLLSNLFDFNWKITAVQYCFGFCHQFSSVAQSCPTLCNPMNCSTPGLPVHHQLPEVTQIQSPIGIHMSPPSGTSLSPPITPHPSRLLQSPSLSTPDSHSKFPVSLRDFCLFNSANAVYGKWMKVEKKGLWFLMPRLRNWHTYTTIQIWEHLQAEQRTKRQGILLPILSNNTDALQSWHCSALWVSGFPTVKWLCWQESFSYLTTSHSKKFCFSFFFWPYHVSGKWNFLG